MSNNEAIKEELKNRLKDYLQSKGIEAVKNKPFTCLNPAHEDKHPSMCFYEDNMQVKCFSCGAKYDIFDLIGIDYNLTDFKDQFKKACELYNFSLQGTKDGQKTDKKGKKDGLKTEKTENKKPENTSSKDAQKNKENKKTIKEASQNIEKCNYLTNRGISLEVQKKHNIGFMQDFRFEYVKSNYSWTLKPVIIIPTSESSFVARNIEQYCNKDERYTKRGSVTPFNFKNATMQAIKDGTPIFLTEGEIDALSLIECGANAIGLGSAEYVNRFITTLKDNIAANECPPIVLCLDADEEGKEATIKIIDALKSEGYILINAVNDNQCEDFYTGCYKDANEMLQKDRKALETNLQKYTQKALKIQGEALEDERETYMQSSNARRQLTEFLNGIKSSAKTDYIPTGFNRLDETLDGGLYEGLYFIGAMSSLGKTTFLLQVADQIAKSGKKDVLIFSLEMSKYELMAKSISRQTLLQSNSTLAKTTKGITTGSKYKYYTDKEINLINEAVKAYSSYADHIYIVEGLGDVSTEVIRENVSKHKKLTGQYPIVIIDYLQILQPVEDDKRLDIRMSLDRSILDLKRMSRDYKIPIIGISSFNRQNYKSPVSMESFKESGAIEYSSDVLIGLQFKGQGSNDFDIDKAKANSNDANTPREIELKILKNRNGKTGIGIYYKYYAFFNYYTEVGYNEDTILQKETKQQAKKEAQQINLATNDIKSIDVSDIEENIQYKYEVISQNWLGIDLSK